MSRSLSDVQESAQYLAGEDLPRILLKGVLTKSQIPGDVQALSLINLTPYDGWLERVARRWHDHETPTYNMKVLSVCKSVPTAQYVEKALALELMEDSQGMFFELRYMRNNFVVLYSCQEWKVGNHTTLGNVRRFEPNPPPASENSIELANFPLTIVKLDYDVDPNKKGWEKFRVSLPTGVRARYVDDAIYGAEWANLLADFDKKLLSSDLL